MFSFFKQRPYDRLANPLTEPRDIFVTANFTAPLAPRFSYLAQGREDELQLALTALTKLTTGKVYLGSLRSPNPHRSRCTSALARAFLAEKSPDLRSSTAVLIAYEASRAPRRHP